MLSCSHHYGLTSMFARAVHLGNYVYVVSVLLTFWCPTGYDLSSGFIWHSAEQHACTSVVHIVIRPEAGSGGPINQSDNVLIFCQLTGHTNAARHSSSVRPVTPPAKCIHLAFDGSHHLRGIVSGIRRVRDSVGRRRPLRKTWRTCTSLHRKVPDQLQYSLCSEIYAVYSYSL